MMNINATSVQGLTDGQLIELIHKSAVVPTMWVSLGISWLLFLGFGLLLIKKKGQNPFKKFMVIWFISVIFSALVALFITFNPHFIAEVLRW